MEPVLSRCAANHQRMSILHLLGLHILRSAGPISSAELRQSLGCGRSMAYRVIWWLEERGLARTISNGNHQITEAGLKLISEQANGGG